MKEREVIRWSLMVTYLAVTVIFISSFFGAMQTYAEVQEAQARFRVFVSEVSMVTDEDNVTIGVEFHFDNPSSLEIEMYGMDTSLYIYNDTSRANVEVGMLNTRVVVAPGDNVSRWSSVKIPRDASTHRMKEILGSLKLDDQNATRIWTVFGKVNFYVRPYYVWHMTTVQAVLPG